MKHYVGLDVSMKETSICILNEQNEIVHESTASTDPHAIEKTGLKIEKDSSPFVIPGEEERKTWRTNGRAMDFS